MYDIEHDEVLFKNEKFPLAVSCGLATAGKYGRFHEAVEIKLVNSGKVTVMIDTKAVIAEAGDIIFVNPYEVHSNLCPDGQDGIYSLFMLPVDFFDKAGIEGINLRKLIMENGIKFKNHIKNIDAAEVLKKIAENRNAETEYDRFYLSALMLEFFAILLKSETVTCKENYNYERIHFFRSVEPAVVQLRYKYYEKFSGDELAGMCKMSRYHFSRVFKRVMGVTPLQYQTECRLHIADILLKNNEISISEIAEKTGFQDEAYFSRCYKKHRGVSPARARLSKK